MYLNCLGYLFHLFVFPPRSCYSSMQCMNFFSARYKLTVIIIIECPKLKFTWPVWVQHCVLFYIVCDSITSALAWKGGRVCLMSSPCLESQGCHLIPIYCLLSCSLPNPITLSVLSFFCLLVHYPDFFSRKILQYTFVSGLILEI